MTGLLPSGERIFGLELSAPHRLHLHPGDRQLIDLVIPGGLPSNPRGTGFLLFVEAIEPLKLHISLGQSAVAPEGTRLLSLVINNPAPILSQPLVDYILQSNLPDSGYITEYMLEHRITNSVTIERAEPFARLFAVPI